MLLAEVHLLRRTFRRPPQLSPPLQGPDLPIGKPAGALALQPLEQRLGFQSGTLFNRLTNLQRDYAMIAMLVGCGLRRGELLALRVDSIQSRDEHWVIADLLGKAGTFVPFQSHVG